MVENGWKYKDVDLVRGGCVTRKVPHLAEEIFLVQIFLTGVTIGKAWITGLSKKLLFICYLRNVLASVTSHSDDNGHDQEDQGNDQQYCPLLAAPDTELL